jgi:hypothetical protein
MAISAAARVTRNRRSKAFVGLSEGDMDMADDTKLGGDSSGLSGAELQQSQITGAGEGEFTRDRMQGQKGGAQMGGGPGESDMASPGGSSGGGYGNAQNQANHQGQQVRPSGHDMHQSRGELFDEQQGGGRGTGSVSDDRVAQAGGSGGSFDQVQDTDALDAQGDALLRDQQAHQDRGQSAAGTADFEQDAAS